MFSLNEIDLTGRILGCADGPAGFNAGATSRGGRVVSFDPIYALSTSEIRGRITATSQDIIEQTRHNQHEFVWTSITSPEELLDIRMKAMELFLADYDAGTAEGRYVTAELPVLPFLDRAFDLALCSHFLFLSLRSARYRVSSRRDSRALPRGERVRIFPLLALGAIGSSHVSPIAASFRELGYTVTIERVPYEFQRGANKMMRIVRTEARA